MEDCNYVESIELVLQDFTQEGANASWQKFSKGKSKSRGILMVGKANLLISREYVN